MSKTLYVPLYMWPLENSVLSTRMPAIHLPLMLATPSADTSSSSSSNNSDTVTNTMTNNNTNNDQRHLTPDTRQPATNNQLNRAQNRCRAQPSSPYVGSYSCRCQGCKLNSTPKYPKPVRT